MKMRLGFGLLLLAGWWFAGFQSNPLNAQSGDANGRKFNIIELKYADAEETVQLLSPFCHNIVADRRTNSLILFGNDDTEHKMMRAIIVRLDETPTKTDSSTTWKQSVKSHSAATDPQNTVRDRLARNAASLDPNQNQDAQELLRSESLALQLADQIRTSSITTDADKAQNEQLAKRLNETLTRALELKFKLEQSQLEALEERVAQVKKQMAQRLAISQLIVQRRASELIEGNAAKWNPEHLNPQPRSKNEMNESAVSPNSDGSNSTTSRADARLNAQVSKALESTESRLANIDVVAGDISTRGNFLGAQNLASRFRAKSDVVQFDEYLLAEHLKANELSNANGKGIAISEIEIQNDRLNLERAILDRKLIIDEYTATMQDLKLQVAAAEVAFKRAESKSSRLQSLQDGFVTKRALDDADKEVAEARLSLDRLKIRYELFKNIGSATGIDGTANIVSDVKKILVTKFDIDPGVRLDSSNVELKEWPLAHVPKGAITNWEEIEDHAIKISLSNGTPVLSHYLASKGQFGITSVIPKGMVIVTVPVDFTMAHSGLLRAGNHVKVTCAVHIPSHNPLQQESVQIKAVLNHARVIAVGNQVAGESAASVGSNPLKFENVSFVVFPRQAELLAFAKEISKGRFHLALLGEQDKAIDDNTEDLDANELQEAKRVLLDETETP